MMKDPDKFELLATRLIYDNGRSKRWVAKKLGYHPSTLTKWFNGINRASFKALNELCDLVEASPEDRRGLLTAAGYEIPAELVTNSDDSGQTVFAAVKDLQTFQELSLDRQAVEAFIQNSSQPTYLRLTVLNAYLLNGWNNQVMFETLALDPVPEVRETIAHYVYKPPDINNLVVLNEVTLDKLLVDPVNDVGAAAIKAARHLVRAGKIPPRFLIRVNKHPYWLVRKIAVQCIAELDTPDMLKLLYEFRTTGYHVTQQTIRDFVKRHFSAHTFTEDQLRLARELIASLMEVKSVSDISQGKNERLLNLLSSKQID